jgi:signal peptidase I
MTKEKKKREQNVFREYFELIVETAIFVFFVMTFVAQASQVPTGSMEDTILIGDFLIINKIAYARPQSGLEKMILPNKAIEKGDTLVFKSPQEEGKDLVKRVIATENDTIEIKDKQVFINGELIAESYKVHKDDRIISKDGYYHYADTIRDNFGPVSVPPGHCFVMGDNRDSSYDSRYWGFLSLNSVKGRPWVIYFSYDAEENSHLKTSLRDRLSRLVQYVPRARWRRMLHVIH